MEFLKDPTTRWLIEMTIVIVVGATPLAVNLFVNRNRKKLWYKRWIFPVMDRDRTTDGMDISLDGESLSNAYVSIIGLRYEGSDPVTEDDYRQSIRMDYEHTRILEATVLETYPEGIKPAIRLQDSGCITLEPLAFNNRNEVVIRVLLSEAPDNGPKVTGHIVGVEKLEDFAARQDLPIKLIIGTAVAILTMCLLLVVLAVSLGESLGPLSQTLAMAVILAILTTFMIGAYNVFKLDQMWNCGPYGLEEAYH